MSLQVYFDIPVNTFPVIQLVPTAQHSKLTDNRIIRPSSSTRHTKSICIPEVYCLSKHCDAPHTSTQETSTSPSTTQSTSSDHFNANISTGQSVRISLRHTSINTNNKFVCSTYHLAEPRNGQNNRDLCHSHRSQDNDKRRHETDLQRDEAGGSRCT